MKSYEEADNDIDSLERYHYRFPSISCVSFLGQQWQLLQKMEDGERKTTLTDQWHDELRKFCCESRMSKTARPAVFRRYT